MAALVGLIGRKRVGKDTFADVLVQHFGFTRIAFADPLKQVALDLDPLVGPCSLPGRLVPEHHPLSEVIEALGWEQAKDEVPGVRRTLQRLGQAIREQTRDYWLELAMQQAGLVGGPVVITDVRMPNEADAIRAAGGTLLRIVRDLPDDGDRDISETALDEYLADAVVPNFGFRQELEYMAAKFGHSLRLLGDLD
jgi:hypothetical protein